MHNNLCTTPHKTPRVNNANVYAEFASVLRRRRVAVSKGLCGWDCADHLLARRVNSGVAMSRRDATEYISVQCVP